MVMREENMVKGEGIKYKKNQNIKYDKMENYKYLKLKYIFSHFLCTL